MSASPQGAAQGWLLALHSSSETFGVAACALGVEGEAPRCAAFPLGRSLSNELLPSVEAVLPAALWPRLTRLAVATGPGGFTGTRLAVVFARTLAQQLGLPLDGVGSFCLMAERLLAEGEAPMEAPFWLVQTLPRRGVVAGLYAAAADGEGGVEERRPPRLLRDEALLAELEPTAPRLAAEVVLPADVERLLARSRRAAAAAQAAPWQPVLPLYPTSPVEVP
ncbi:MAG: tRNA (adenosine(37)-N6)-threonylcarbamoyltransferase complex dimerization subunit type 1 TsaB [Synechococcus sp.]|nr:tRNA (adenosine(37)-N6)-threonylcarbamoyltransferase complex dimerization subunit type 1 TsaB [Synechococcus sp.]